MKVFIAIPAYDGKVGVETVRCLLDEKSLAVIQGIDLQFAFLPGCSLITLGRNQLAADFLASDCDRLVFIDTDVSWDFGALVRLIQHPVDVVGGAYRLKREPEEYPIRWLEKAELWADPETGLLEVDSVPGGFLSITRQAFEKLKEAYPDRDYEWEGREFQAFFHAPFADGKIWGEDTAFCNDWRKAGGQVWLDPTLTLTHAGGSPKYTGCIGDWLRSRA